MENFNPFKLMLFLAIAIGILLLYFVYLILFTPTSPVGAFF